MIKWSRINFHSWNFPPYNHLIHEHEDLQPLNLCQHFWDHLWKSYTEFHVWFWESSCSKGRYFVFSKFLQLTVINVMRFLMLDNENEVVNVRYTILDSAVLKIIIFPSGIIFLILHKFKTFCILVMLLTIFFVFVTFDYKKIVHLGFL